jgi:hypothetical protein
MVFMALYPELLAAPQLQNPIGLTGSIDDLMRSVQDSALLVTIPVALALLAALSLILRFRRSAGVERQQLKWFAYVVGLAAANIALPLYLIADWLGAVTAVLHWLLLMSIAGAIGLAILRYRLYDIDRIISRTLVYGLLTGLLGLVYVGLVLCLGQLFGGIGAQPPSWAVAGATLAVAALFQPLRRRIQQAVDRRFNRRRYDATQTIEAFSVRLREEVDLDSLSAELLAVVDQTMQPTNASLWLRPSARQSGRTAGPRRSLVMRHMSGSLLTTCGPLAGAEAVFTAAASRRSNGTNRDESRERRGPGAHRDLNCTRGVVASVLLGSTTPSSWADAAASSHPVPAHPGELRHVP